MSQPPQQPYGQQPYGQQPQQPYGQPPQTPPKKSRKWPWIVGGIIAVLVIAGIATGGGDDTTSKTADSTGTAAEAPAQAPAQAPAEPTTIPPLTAAPQSGPGKTIVYEVISDSSTLNNVTWFDEDSAMQQDSNASAPWTLTVNNNSSFVMAGVTAQTDGTSVTCRVTVDGKVEAEETATGQYAVVNCTASVF